MGSIFLFSFGIVLMILGFRAWPTRSRGWLLRWGQRVVAITVIVPGFALTTWGGAQFALTHRPEPSEITQEALFQGVTYTREVRDDPRPLVIHVVEIDLTAPGVRFEITPPDQEAAESEPSRELLARTTSRYVRESGVQIAVNASFFDPSYDILPWYFYPRNGDTVNTLGLTASAGEVYSEPRRGFRTLHIGPNNEIAFDDPANGTVYHAVSGLYMFLRQGETWIPRPGTNTRYNDLAPRTGVAINQRGDRLLLFVIDGRQPNYSEGVSMPEFAAIAREYGGYTALNLDGGGSSTLVIEDEDGRPHILNSPIHNDVPGRERPVASHVGVFAQPLN